ncbi:MAG: hypothetical protein J7L99_01285 [Planctomycetes bacterium]|nr:hypothetical protein [Planctomycetota bacterium]
MELKATNKGKTNLPFAVNERRLLTIRAERIAPKYLIAGKPTIQAGKPTIQAGKPPKVDAQQVRIERYPTHNARYYRIAIETVSWAVNIQLNGGSSADDEERLQDIVEELLAIDEVVEITNEPASLH